MDEPIDPNVLLQELMNRWDALAATLANIQFQMQDVQNRAQLILQAGLGRIELNEGPNQAFYAPHQFNNSPDEKRVIDILVQHLQSEEFGEHYIVHFGPELPAPQLKQMIIKRGGLPNVPINDRPWEIMMWQGAGRNPILRLVPILTKGGQPSVVGPDMIFYCANGRQGLSITRFLVSPMGGGMIPIITNRIVEAVNTLGLLTEAIQNLAPEEGEDPSPYFQQAMDNCDQNIARMDELEKGFNDLVISVYHLRDNLPNAVNANVNANRSFY